MQFIKDNKWYVAGLLTLLFAGWYYFAPSGSDELLSSSADSAVPSPLSQELLATLSSLHVIKLDETLFTDPVFVSLSDFGVQIPPENVGRRNPFAPFVGSGGSGSISAPSGL